MYITKRGAIYILGWGGGGSEGRTQHDIHEVIHIIQSKKLVGLLLLPLYPPLSPRNYQITGNTCADHLLVHINSNAFIIHMFLSLNPPRKHIHHVP